MNRLQAGLIAGAIGAVIGAVLGFIPQVAFCGPIVSIIAGTVAGVLAGRNVAFAGKGAGAGALAGLLAGVVTLVGLVIAGVILNNNPAVQDGITAASQTAAPTLTAVAEQGGSTGSTTVNLTQIASAGIVALETCLGLVGAGLAAGAGAIGGAIAGRNVQPPMPPGGLGSYPSPYPTSNQPTTGSGY